MYKKFYIVFIFLILTSPFSLADNDLSNFVNQSIDKFYNSLSKNTNKFIKNYFGNEGTTEASITAGENMKPIGSIVLVRPLTEMKIDSVWFSQTQINNYSIEGKDRQALNIGIGYRKLSEDKSFFYGLNSFFDIDSKNHRRASIGAELVSMPFELTANYYSGLTGSITVGDFNERVLDGYDIIIGGQIPYLPWAKIYFENYNWDSIKNTKDSSGNKLSTEFRLTDNISLEAGLDDNELSGQDEYIKVTYVYPPSDQLTISDKLFSDVAFEKSDVSSQILRKAKRTNKVVVELEGSLIVKGF